MAISNPRSTTCLQTLRAMFKTRIKDLCMSLRSQGRCSQQESKLSPSDYVAKGEFQNKNSNSAWACSGPRAILKARIYSKSGVFAGAMCMSQPRSTNIQKQKRIVKQRFSTCGTMLTEGVATSKHRHKRAYVGQGDFQNKNSNSAWALTTPRAIFKTRIKTRPGRLQGQGRFSKQ